MTTAILLGLKAFLGRLVTAMVTEKMIAKLTFWGLKELAAKTTNKVDDKLVTEVEAAYYGD